MFEKPSQREIANEYRIQFAASHPRLRMSIVTYLMENGTVPNNTSMPLDEFIPIADGLVDWITAEGEDFYEFIEGLNADDDEDEDLAQLKLVVENEQNQDGYL